MWFYNKRTLGRIVFVQDCPADGAAPEVWKHKQSARKIRRNCDGNCDVWIGCVVTWRMVGEACVDIVNVCNTTSARSRQKSVLQHRLSVFGRRIIIFYWRIFIFGQRLWVQPDFWECHHHNGIPERDTSFRASESVIMRNHLGLMNIYTWHLIII